MKTLKNEVSAPIREAQESSLAPSARSDYGEKMVEVKKGLLPDNLLAP